MSFLGIGVVISQVEAQLKASLAAKCTALNAEYNDGVTIAEPRTASYFSYLTDPRLIPVKPALIIRRGPRTVAETPPAFGGEHVFSNAFAVDIVLQGRDPATLTKQMDRYVRAVSEILCGGALACGQPELEHIGYEEPQLTDRKSGDHLQDVPLFFNLTTFESPT